MPPCRSTQANFDSLLGCHHAYDVVAGFLVALQFNQLSCPGFLEQLTKRFEAVIGLAKTRLAPFDGRLDHGPPYRLAGTFGSESFNGFQDQIESFLLAVGTSLLASCYADSPPSFFGTAFGLAGRFFAVRFLASSSRTRSS